MNHRPLHRTALTFAVALLAAGATRAADPGIHVDMQLAGGRLIDAGSLQFGAGVAVNAESGASKREASPPSLSDIIWTQQLDTTYPLLLNKALSGAVTSPAKIDLVSLASKGGKPYLSLTADRALLTGLSMSNDSVSGSITFDKLTMTYDPFEFGKTGPKITTSYDLAKSRVDGPSGRAPTPGTGSTPAATGGGTSMYLRLGSGSTAIAGESTAMGYENWIRIDSAQMGVGVAVSAASGGGPRTTSVPSISELTISQPFDATVPVVFADLLRGTNIGQATIEYVTNAGAGPVTFMQLVLDEVIFSGLSLSTGGDRPSISESLNFSGFSQTVWNIRDDGTRGGFTSVGYDMTKAGPKATAGKLADSVSGFGGGLVGLSSAAAGVEAPLPAPLPVPEPQTWLMMLAGIGLLAGAARRRATA